MNFPECLIQASDATVLATPPSFSPPGDDQFDLNQTETNISSAGLDLTVRPSVDRILRGCL